MRRASPGGLMVPFEHAHRMADDVEVGIINVQLPPTWSTGPRFEFQDASS